MRAAKAVCALLFFSRQRSASTTFVGLLNLHPNITCRWEAFSNSFTASKMRTFLGIANRSDQLADIPEYMSRFWRACPTRACGFKLFNSQIRPQDRIKEVFSIRRGGSRIVPRTAADGSSDGVVPSPVPVKRLILERADIAGEFESWRRAQSTGNWGTSPEAQVRFHDAVKNVTSSGASSTRSMAFHHKAHNTGCRGCDLEAVAKNQAYANAIGPARFGFQHRAWFRLAREVGADLPLLHIYSENLTVSMVACNRTMARVYAFLELPPLRENCNMSSLPIEWPCDIQQDPQCSMEKFAAASVPSPSASPSHLRRHR